MGWQLPFPLTESYAAASLGICCVMRWVISILLALKLQEHAHFWVSDIVEIPTVKTA